MGYNGQGWDVVHGCNGQSWVVVGAVMDRAGVY